MESVDISEQRAFVGEHQIRVQFGDCDPASLVYFPNYFTWVNDATWAYFEALCKAADIADADQYMFPLTGINASFLKPMRWRATAVLRTTCTRIGVKSFSMHHDMLLNSDVTAHFDVDHVLTRRPSGLGEDIRSAPVPAAMRALMLKAF